MLSPSGAYSAKIGTDNPSAGWDVPVVEDGVCDVVLGLERLPVSVTVVPGPMEPRKVGSCKGNVTVAPVVRTVAPVRGLRAVIHEKVTK
jgi:hypothetical protein